MYQNNFMTAQQIRRSQIVNQFQQSNQHRGQQPANIHPQQYSPQLRPQQNMIQRDEDMTLGNLRNPFGAEGLMTPCGDNDFMSLTFGGMNPLGDAFSWTGSNVDKLIDKFILWTAPEELTGETPTPREYIVTDVCAPRPRTSWGADEYLIQGYSFMGRSSQPTSIYDSDQPCENTEFFRLDNSLIDDNFEWAAAQATSAIMDDFSYWMVLGDGANTNETSGLIQLLSVGKTNMTGGPIPWMDPVNINWNGGDAVSVAGATWTDGRHYNWTTSVYDPLAIPTGTHIMTLLRSYIHHCMIRIKYSPLLASQLGALGPGSLFIFGVDEMLQCLLDYAACYRLCGNVVDYSVLYTEKGQNFRNSLMGGMYGFGEIPIEGLGFRVPLVSAPEYFDNGMAAGRHRLGIVWKQLGGVRLMYGDYRDMNNVSGQGGARNLSGGGNIRDMFGPTDGGRLMHYESWDQTCFTHTVDFHPRFVEKTPFLNFLAEDIACSQPGGQLSAIPTAANYFGGTRLTPATKS